jgi:hypothetical protein
MYDIVSVGLLANVSDIAKNVSHIAKMCRTPFVCRISSLCVCVESCQSRGNAEQLVVGKMDKDPAKRAGVRTVMHKIAFEDGIHMTRYGQSCCII